MWGKDTKEPRASTGNSEFVRRRDFIQFGRCISCRNPVSDWRQFDAGHFISAGGGGFALLFDERNVNGECQYDNAFNGNHLLLYRRGLDERYGPGTSALNNAIETHTSKANPRKSGAKGNTKQR